MPPIFSIITITYNAACCLEKTISSILNQSYPHIEYLIIDGNSTDGTVDIIKQYEAGISYWISEPDEGLYDAMNKGLRKATGDYVWFINAGDLIYSGDTVRQIVSLLAEGDSLPDIIYGDTLLIDEGGRSLGARRLRPPERLSWKSFRMGMLVSHQSFIVKRTIAPEFDLQYRYSSDIDWCIRCMKGAKSIFNTRMVLSRFLDGGLSTVRRKASLKERYHIMCKYYGTISTVVLHGWFAVRFYFAKWFKRKV
ncbi:PGL/p-HBAD biosynthesis glycosyltransferase [Bacteroidales bacterium Barb6]|nr:PGL/p-HBAD biosynthesis glycosyltransferase [Bacteroidales bacterium Barb6]